MRACAVVCEAAAFPISTQPRPPTRPPDSTLRIIPPRRDYLPFSGFHTLSVLSAPPEASRLPSLFPGEGTHELSSTAPMTSILPPPRTMSRAVPYQVGLVVDVHARDLILPVWRSPAPNRFEVEAPKGELSRVTAMMLVRAESDTKVIAAELRLSSGRTDRRPDRFHLRGLGRRWSRSRSSGPARAGDRARLASPAPTQPPTTLLVR